MPDNKPPPQRLPLRWLPDAAKRSKVVNVIAEHLHVLQIVEDHEYEFAVCSTDVERRAVCDRCRWQVARAVGRTVGVDMSLHGVGIVATGNFLAGSSLMVVGAVVAYILTRGGK